MVDWKKFGQLLREAKYDANETKFIEDGFTKGFEIGYEGPRNRRKRARNLPLSTAYFQGLVSTLKAGRYRDFTRKNYHKIWRKFNHFNIKLDRMSNTWEDRLVV